MTFENSIWLWLSPLLGLISVSILALGWRKRSHLLGRFAAPRLLDQLTQKASAQRSILKSVLIVTAICAIGIALARPQFGTEWSERKARGLDIVFALDSSKSMLATDLRPTRLDRAKLAVLDIIDRLESDRIGLVAFSGEAFLQTPPTLDYAAFRESLNATDPSILSRGGSDLGRAIEEGAKAFPTANNVKIVILLTDGEDLGGQAIEAAKRVADDGIRLFTIGIGTPEGEYLRIRNEEGIEEFVRDASGQPVRSQLDEFTLQQIAQITGGSYLQLRGASLDAFYQSVLATLPREERESELQEVKIERYQWLLAVALIFLVLEILIRSRQHRTMQVSLLLTGLLILNPNASEARDTARQFYNDAHTALIEGDYEKANELYTAAMQESSDRSLQRDALYNMGHASYQQGLQSYHSGDLEAALKRIKKSEGFFNSARQIDPSDDAIPVDAKKTKAVREAIEQLIKQQKQQEPPENQEQQNQESPPSEEKENQEAAPQENQEGPEDQNQQPQERSESEQEDPSPDRPEKESNQNQSSEADNQTPSESNDSENAASGDREETENAGQNDAEIPTDEGQQPPAEETPDPNQQTNLESDEESPPPQTAGPGETTNDAAGNATEPPLSAQVEGITVEEAQDLLDSLQSKEEILPFTKPVPGRGRPVQDW